MIKGHDREAVTFVYKVIMGRYLVTLSSHLTMPNMVPIEITQTARKTAQATQIG
jgi:hypothetical protein